VDVVLIVGVGARLMMKNLVATVGEMKAVHPGHADLRHLQTILLPSLLMFAAQVLQKAKTAVRRRQSQSVPLPVRRGPSGA